MLMYLFICYNGKSYYFYEKMTISATSTSFACGFPVAIDLGTQITPSVWNSTSALISPHAELSERSGTVQMKSIIPRSFVQHAALTLDLSLSNTTHRGARGWIQTVFKCGKRTCFPFCEPDIQWMQRVISWR